MFDAMCVTSSLNMFWNAMRIQNLGNCAWIVIHLFWDASPFSFSHCLHMPSSIVCTKCRSVKTALMYWFILRNDPVPTLCYVIAVLKLEKQGWVTSPFVRVIFLSLGKCNWAVCQCKKLLGQKFQSSLERDAHMNNQIPHGFYSLRLTSWSQINYSNTNTVIPSLTHSFVRGRPFTNPQVSRCLKF